MKNRFKICCIFSILFFAWGCEDLAEINTKETTIYEIDPANHIYQASSIIKGSSFEFFYDYVQGSMSWMQFIVGSTGNSAKFVEYNSNMGQRYGLYTNSGSYVKDIREYVKSHFSENEQALYQNIIEVSKIILIYQGIYTSDTHGSLVYNEGWQARYGGITDPAFEVQQDLYNEWDNELKNAIAVLKKTDNSQQGFASFDLAYAGDKNQWIKAANALRLRLATRWIKRDLNKAKSIAAEVLGSNAAELFSTNNDGWTYRFQTIFTEHSNFNSIYNYRASHSLMNFFKSKNDPRIRMFFRKNTYSPENVALWNSQNPDKTITYNPDQYLGGHVNPAVRTKPAIAPEYATPNRTVKRADGSEITMDTLSLIQQRHFQATFDNGTGISWMPCITYADFCFMAAEFSSYGVASSKTTQQWYEEGVKSSLNFWNSISKDAGIHDYIAMTDTEISTYMQTDGIKWDASKGLEQIACQAVIDQFKNTNEAWSIWKRLGYPNFHSVYPVEELFDDDGASQLQLPRRQTFTYPMAGTANYDNYKKRIDDMAADPDFGTPSSPYGRIWWDKK